MSTFNFSGIATGLDTAAIVSQLVAIKRLPIDRLEASKGLYQRQLTALTDLKSKLQALNDAMAALDTPNEFGSLAATSSDEGRLTVSASSLASPGTYDIVVHSLASHEKQTTAGFASLTDNLGSGSLKITIDGKATQLDLTEPVNNLTDIKAAINEAGLGVHATILNDGTDGTPYRLILTSEESGLDAAFTATWSGDFGADPSFTMSSLTAAQDASLEIDTLPVVSSSNSVGSAITGLTLDLHQADPGTTMTVSVATDGEAITQKIQALVDAYNDLMAFKTSQTAEDGTLRGNPTLQSVTRRLQSLFVLPVANGSGDLTHLSQVGISQGEGGQLNFDSADFQTALADDYSSVRDLFVERGENLGKAYLIRTALDDMTDSVDGIFKISSDSINDKIRNIDDTIVRYERSVESYRTTLQRKFTAMETLVANLQAQGSSLVNGLGRLGY